MIQSKKKQCDGCDSPQYIWKNEGGKRYCKTCWTTGVAKPQLSDDKPTVPRSRIPPRSQKRSREERLYLAMRIIFLGEHPMCEARLQGCTGKSTDVHHKAGRIGKLLLDILYWLSVCRHCHDWIENNPSEAKERGFSVSRLQKESDINIINDEPKEIS